jgi:hypothetical protein
MLLLNEVRDTSRLITKSAKSSKLPCHSTLGTFNNSSKSFVRSCVTFEKR